MKMISVFRSTSALLVLSILVACSPQQAAPGTAASSQAQAAPAPEICTTCGVVSSVTEVSQAGSTTGTGAVLGAIVGGVAGNQVGGGSGKKIATAAGVIGGALIGNNIEQNRNSTSVYDIVINMDGGGQQIIRVEDSLGISPGTAVSVQGSNITLL